MPNNIKKRTGLQIQHTLLLCDYYQNGNVPIIFSQTQHIKFHENPFQHYQAVDRLTRIKITGTFFEIFVVNAAQTLTFRRLTSTIFDVPHR